MQPERKAAAVPCSTAPLLRCSLLLSGLSFATAPASARGLPAPGSAPAAADGCCMLCRFGGRTRCSWSSAIASSAAWILTDGPAERGYSMLRFPLRFLPSPLSPWRGHPNEGTANAAGGLQTKDRAPRPQAAEPFCRLCLRAWEAIMKTSRTSPNSPKHSSSWVL